MSTQPRADMTERTPSRVASIDIFRGLTMALMIFVNALSEVPGLPWWNYHAPAKVDAMTYPDVVFPLFLFAVGLSLPLAVAQRLRRTASTFALWRHVLERFAGLLVLGLILANAGMCDATRTGMNGNLWALLGLLGGVLYLHVPPRAPRWQRLSRLLRWVGLAGVVVLFALFRRTTGQGHTAWISTSYPEILGLIAYSYLGVCLLYLPTRRYRWAAPAWCLVMTVFCALTTAHWIRLHLPLYEWPFSNGSMCCLIFGGIFVSSLFTGERPSPRAVLLALGFGLAALAAGWLLAPLGISKIRATPAWTLWSLGAGVLAFVLLYWICDRRGHTAWAGWVHAAGANTLLTYLLPDLWYFALAWAGITFYDAHWRYGPLGVFKTLLFTGLMLALAGLLTRARLRLQL